MYDFPIVIWFINKNPFDIILNAKKYVAKPSINWTFKVKLATRFKKERKPSKSSSKMKSRRHNHCLKKFRFVRNNRVTQDRVCFRPLYFELELKTNDWKIGQGESFYYHYWRRTSYDTLWLSRTVSSYTCLVQQADDQGLPQWFATDEEESCRVVGQVPSNVFWFIDSTV